MPTEFEYTPLEDALRTLERNCDIQPRHESVDVRQAYGRVLAGDVVARSNFPPRDSSHFDGFAVRASDIAAALPSSPVSLALKKGVALGRIPRVHVGRGDASAVSTGGFLPDGADTVVPVEDAKVVDGRVLVSRAVPRGGYVYPEGRDMKRGERLLAAGRTLRSQDLVLLLSIGAKRVLVFERPDVSILPTGSELTDHVGRPKGRVVESHSVMISRLVEEAGGCPARLAIVPDERDALVRGLKGALKLSDIVLTLAGSSVGEPDLVESAIKAIGKPDALVHGVKVNRGRVMGFAVLRGKPIVLLPGPIQAALNAFATFGYPLIRTYLGRPMERPHSIPATVTEDWRARGRYSSFDQIVYVKIQKTDEGMLATPSTAETEKVSFLLGKDGYTLVPGAKGGLKKGDRILVRLLPGFSPALGH